MTQITLLYHDVLAGDSGPSGFPGADADSYKLDYASFRSHVDRIAEVASGRVTLAPRSGNAAVPAGPPVHLAFDDGGASAHELTAEVLESHGFRGHFFIVTARVGEPGFLTADQIRDLAARGHDIGSHSHSHPQRFSEIGYGHLLTEWRESRRILAEILGEAPYTASVPGGFYSRDVARAAHEAGYSVLFNSEPTPEITRFADLAILGRFSVKRGDPSSLAQALAAGEAGPRARQALLWNAKKPLKKLGGKRWHEARAWFFTRTAGH